MEYISAYISTIAMCILVYVTFLYLKETKNIRKVYEKSFYYEISPKAFLEDVNSTVQLNDKKRSLEFFTTLRFKNTGKTEAFKFEHEYSFISGNISMKGKFGPMPYLHPGRGIKTETKLFDLSLKDDNLFNFIKKAKDENKPINIANLNFPPISLNVTVRYLDQNKKLIKYQYTFEYQLEKNIWVYKC